MEQLRGLKSWLLLCGCIAEAPCPMEQLRGLKSWLLLCAGVWLVALLVRVDCCFYSTSLCLKLVPIGSSTHIFLISVAGKDRVNLNLMGPRGVRFCSLIGTLHYQGAGRRLRSYYTNDSRPLSSLKLHPQRRRCTVFVSRHAIQY